MEPQVTTKSNGSGGLPSSRSILAYVTAVPLGIAAIVMLIFVPSAHVTMCMVCAIGYSAGLPLEKSQQLVNKVISFLGGGILFYTVYAGTTPFFIELINNQSVESSWFFIDPAWLYHFFINFALLVMFRLRRDVMAYVIYGIEFFLLTSPVLFLLQTLFGRDLSPSEAQVVPVFMLMGLAIFTVHRLVAWLVVPEIYQQVLDVFRNLIIGSLWVYAIVMLVIFVAAIIGAIPVNPDLKNEEQFTREQFPDPEYDPYNDPMSPDYQGYRPEQPYTQPQMSDPSPSEPVLRNGSGGPVDPKLLEVMSWEELQADLSDTFFVGPDDYDKIASTFPYAGAGTACGHKGGHVYFKQTGQEYTVDIHSPVDAVIGNISLCSIATTANGYQHDKFDILLTVAHHEYHEISMAMSFEPFAGLNCQQDPNYYQQYIFVEKGDVVERGDVIAKIPKYLDAIDDNTHIHFHVGYNGPGGGGLYCPNIFSQQVAKDFQSLNGDRSCKGDPFTDTFCYQPEPGDNLNDLLAL